MLAFKHRNGRIVLLVEHKYESLGAHSMPHQLQRSITHPTSRYIIARIPELTTLNPTTVHPVLTTSLFVKPLPVSHIKCLIPLYE